MSKRKGTQNENVNEVLEKISATPTYQLNSDVNDVVLKLNDDSQVNLLYERIIVNHWKQLV